MEVILNSIISRLLKGQVKDFIPLTEKEIKFLCLKIQNILMSQEILLEIKAPVKICGDIHGQFYDLLRLFEFGGLPPNTKYLFLGDYVDRGKHSIETICLLFALKIKFPKFLFILRGNHESSQINRIYGFYDECKRRYTVKTWKLFGEIFNCLPVCAIVEKKIFCIHGGLSPSLKSLKQIKEIKRPIEIPDSGLLCDLLWSDPIEKTNGWKENDRGVSFVFGKNVVFDFLKRFNFELICRAHQVVENGYQFFGDRTLITIFSAPNYCGEFDNAGAIMNIEKSLLCSFQVLKPLKNKTKEKDCIKKKKLKKNINMKKIKIN